jgi:membrane protein DedA with SNARE-associated domain
MRFKTFFIASTLGTLGWTALLAAAGFKMREHYGEMEQWVGSASNAVLVVLAAGYLWRVWTHRNPTRED